MGQDHGHDHEVNYKSIEGMLGSCPNIWYKICTRAWSHYYFAKASETMKVCSSGSNPTARHKVAPLLSGGVLAVESTVYGGGVTVV